MVDDDRPVQVLDTMPGTAGLYARAALGSVGKGGAKAGLPSGAVAVAEVNQEVDQLAAYNRICGFALADTVPATWLHVLTFPLQLALMTARDFPFAVVGMVHVENRMRQHRPVTVTEQLSLSVHADDLRPHRAGAQLDIVEQARVEDELVWEGASTYLVKGAKVTGEPSTDQGSFPDPEALTAVALWRLPAGLGRRYAKVSGDANPIHLNPLAAKAFGFPRTIAHGMYSYARALAALTPRLPQAYETRVQFRKPVLLPSTVRLARGATDTGEQFAVTSKDGSRVHLVGDVTAA